MSEMGSPSVELSVDGVEALNQLNWLDEWSGQDLSIHRPRSVVIGLRTNCWPTVQSASSTTAINP